MKINLITQRAAFEMFRDWTKIAKERYPAMDFTIVDETVLVNDTKESMSDALISLFSEKHDEDRQSRGWCIGFVKGFIRGNLSVGWFHEYYQKQSDNYKNFIAVKSIIEYFKVDSDLGWRLDAIYREFFKSINLENIELRTKVDVDFLKKYDLKAPFQKGIVEQVLNNMLTMFIRNNAKETSFELPDKEYFSDEEILLIIEKYCKDTGLLQEQIEQLKNKNR